MPHGCDLRTGGAALCAVAPWFQRRLGRWPGPRTGTRGPTKKRSSVMHCDAERTVLHRNRCGDSAPCRRRGRLVGSVLRCALTARAASQDAFRPPILRQLRSHLHQFRSFRRKRPETSRVCRSQAGVMSNGVRCGLAPPSTRLAVRAWRVAGEPGAGGLMRVPAPAAREPPRRQKAHPPGPPPALAQDDIAKVKPLWRTRQVGVVIAS